MTYPLRIRSSTGLLWIFRDRHKEWRWHFVAKNNRAVACSGEGFKHRSGALRAAMRACEVMGATIPHARLAINRMRRTRAK